MDKRVLIAGLFHETHTFLEGRTRLEDFEARRGEELLAAHGDSSPLGGVLDFAHQAGWLVNPAVDLRAMPGPVVEDRAVEQFWRELRTVAESGALDGVLLVLHGAMVSESFDDVEGELLARLHSRVPLPVCGVIDLHANFTAAMADCSAGLVAYRENPHTDAREAAIRAARLLDRLMRTRERPVTVRAHPPLMWPPTGTGTTTQPMKSLETAARDIEAATPEILAVNVLAGFAFADAPDAGVSLSAVTLGDPERARHELQQLSNMAQEMRELGNRVDAPLEEIMGKLAGHRKGPVLIVEPSDNIGAGASGRGTAVLRAFLRHGVRNAAVVINAPEAVQSLAGVQIGRRASIRLCAPFEPEPLMLEVELLRTSDGRFELEDRHSHLASMFGGRIDMGPCAVVRHEGVQILLTSRKTPPFDLGQLRSQGIEPETLFAVGVKAAVAHRRAYDPIAAASYSVDTPGPCSSNLKQLPYRKVRRPIYPLDD